MTTYFPTHRVKAHTVWAMAHIAYRLVWASGLDGFWHSMKLWIQAMHKELKKVETRGDSTTWSLGYGA